MEFTDVIENVDDREQFETNIKMIKENIYKMKFEKFLKTDNVKNNPSKSATDIFIEFYETEGKEIIAEGEELETVQAVCFIDHEDKKEEFENWLDAFKSEYAEKLKKYKPKSNHKPFYPEEDDLPPPPLEFLRGLKPPDPLRGLKPKL